MKTVLVVDDLESVRYYHALVLGRSGYRALTASNGAEALELVAREAVDLVMLDLVMPGMSGEEFVGQLQRGHARLRLPVLVISSEAQLEAARQLARDWGCEVLQKPILPDALLAAADRLLGSGTAR
jgi:CheY-like chemotaxis protein